MEKTIVKLTGLAFLVITGFTAGSYYTMHKLTDVEVELPDDMFTMPHSKLEEKCSKGDIVVIKKKQYLCMPLSPK